jgi:hypothetical protein
LEGSTVKSRRTFLAEASVVGAGIALSTSRASDPPPSRRPKGLALGVGLNRVDPGHYAGWDGELGGSENDAVDMMSFAQRNGFTTKLLRSQEATRNGVIRSIAEAADRLNAGDVFFFFYSGHGGRLPDLNGDEPNPFAERPGGTPAEQPPTAPPVGENWPTDFATPKDATYCLYDAMLIDDEFFDLLCKFKRGVRVVVMTDCCHSQSLYRFEREGAGPEPPMPAAVRNLRLGNSRSANFGALKNAFARNREFYEPLLRRPGIGNVRTDLQASVLFLAACGELETALDGFPNGLFTTVVKTVLARPSGMHSYLNFATEVRRIHLAAKGRTSVLTRLNSILPDGRDLVYDRPFAIG